MKSEVELHENTQPKRATDLPPSERRRSAARKKKKNRKLMGMIVVLCAVLAALLLLLGILSGNAGKFDNPLLGRWDLDGITAYEFGEDGMGKLLLPSSEYEFQYTIKGDNLSIDFVHEGARDAAYQFSVQGDTLVLIGGNANTQDTYTFTKIQ